MYFSQHSLHRIVIQSAAHKSAVSAQLTAIAEEQRRGMPKLAAAITADSAVIPLTTVSLASNFDAYINIQFRGQPAGALTSLLVDSGNSMLIVPRWEDIENLPGYTVLGEGKEPWGSPAKIVRGPIDIPTQSGGVHSLEDCVFYACTDAPRTANFGAGCLRSWSASSSATPAGVGVTMQSPLSYNAQYPFAEFNYAPAARILASEDSPGVAQESELIVHRFQPGGYWISDIIPNLEWMSLVPKSLTIGSVLTQWPGNVALPIAMIDTGGGSVFLSDPNGYVYKIPWLSPTNACCPFCPGRTSTCQCISSDIIVELGSPDSPASMKYAIRVENLPAPAQGLTLVMCEVNKYMRGQQGMNIGGLSALFNTILIDYQGAKVGLKSK